MTIKASSSSQISECKAKLAEVKATAGSGKTHTLIQRLRFWASKGVPADKILVLSYSKETVAELQHRIKLFPNKSMGQPSVLADNESLDAYLSKVTIQTTHGFANGLLPQQEVLSEKTAVALFSKAIKAVQRDCGKLEKSGRTCCPRLKRHQQVRICSSKMRMAASMQSK